MFAIHIPVVEIILFLMTMRRNRPFMRISRIFMLSLVALAAIGCAGEWVKALDASSPAFVIGKWDCYQGSPLSLAEFVFQLGAPETLFLLPLIILFCAFLLLFKPPRTYLSLLALSIVSLLVHISSEATPYLYYGTGSGNYLCIFAMGCLFFLTFPLALDEQMRLHPDWDYRAYLPVWMVDSMTRRPM